jgi:hypothetical protein
MLLRTPAVVYAREMAECVAGPEFFMPGHYGHRAGERKAGTRGIYSLADPELTVNAVHTTVNSVARN